LAVVDLAHAADRDAVDEEVLAQPVLVGLESQARAAETLGGEETADELFVELEVPPAIGARYVHRPSSGPLCHTPRGAVHASSCGRWRDPWRRRLGRSSASSTCPPRACRGGSGSWSPWRSRRPRDCRSRRRERPWPGIAPRPPRDPSAA